MCQPSGTIGPDSSDGYPNSAGGQEIVSCNRVVDAIVMGLTGCWSGPNVGAPQCGPFDPSSNECQSIQVCNVHWYMRGSMACGQTLTVYMDYNVYDAGVTYPGHYVIGSYTRC